MAGWLVDVVIALGGAVVVAAAVFTLLATRDRARPVPRPAQPVRVEFPDYAPGIPICPDVDAMGVCQLRKT